MTPDKEPPVKITMYNGRYYVLRKQPAVYVIDLDFETIDEAKKYACECLEFPKEPKDFVNG